MRDDFDEKTKDILARRVGFRCSNPKCRKLTSGPQDNPQKSISIGVAAHIAAAAQGGKRYNPNQTIEQRKSIGNGLWLCQSCSKLIDSDEARYTVELLKAWKKQAESIAIKELEESPTSQTVNNIDPLELLLELLDEPANWVKVPDDQYIRHKYNTQFVIKQGKTITQDYAEPWTKKFPDPSAWSHYVEYWQGSTLLKSSYFVVTDGGRYTIPLPKLINHHPEKDGWEHIEFYINLNTLEWKTAMLFEQYAPLQEVLPRVGVVLKA